jgi:hypothetical protein
VYSWVRTRPSTDFSPSLIGKEIAVKFSARRIVRAVVAVVPLVLGSAGVAAAQAPAAGVGGMTAAATLAAAAPCRPAVNAFNRTLACTVRPFQLVLVRNGISVGSVSGTIQQAYTLATNSRTFTERIDLRVARVTSGAGGARETLRASCGGTCRASVHFPQGAGLVAGRTVSGSISYHDTTRTANRTRTTYLLTPLKAGFVPVPVAFRSLDYRCDNEVGGISAGCVFPTFTPVMTSMARLPNIAANIRRIQHAGPHHYGVRVAGGHPLHRTTNPKIQSANNRVACPASRPRPAMLQCDEYPFATTLEGASRTRRPDWDWTWVPAGEQRQQGGLLNGFYRQNRILNGDAFWVAV